jgi:hypothetical protein
MWARSKTSTASGSAASLFKALPGSLDTVKGAALQFGFVSAIAASGNLFVV